MLNAPRQLLASGVRAVETMTASVIAAAHAASPLNVPPSAASRASSGAGFQKFASSVGFAANCFMRRTTSNSPTVSAYSIGPPRQIGKP